MRIGAWVTTGINLYNNYQRHYKTMSTAMQRISSGYRINSAADDAAGLAISEKMRAQIRGLDMASRNIQDGISLVQTAEGALHESQAILHRMRELSIQAANDTLTDNDRSLIEVEFQELKKEITRIGNDTEFNTRTLLNGDYSINSLKIQAGANAGQTIELTFNDMRGTALGLDTLSLATRDQANASIAALDTSLNRVSSERARLGAYQNRMEHSYNNVTNTAENLTASESRIRDADIAKEMMNLVKADILSQASHRLMAIHMQQAYSILKLLDIYPRR